MPLGIISSVVGGIAGIASSGAQRGGQAAAGRAANKGARQSVKNTNRYNKRVAKYQEKFIRDQRQYNYETAMTNWQYQQGIQNYQYDAQVRAYNRDQQNLANQLAMNDLAAKQGYISEQRVMNEIHAADAFARQDSYIENLQAAGRAKLGAAGQSTDRAIQMTAMEYGRNLAIMDASFTSAIEQHNLNMFDISLNKFGADMNAKANAMLRPERLPGLPQPTMPPLPNFQEPDELIHYKIKGSSGGGAGAVLGGIGGILGSIGGSLGGLAGGTPTGIPGG